MCTSLLYLDAANQPYLGRTLELSVELPYQISFVPQGSAFISALDGYSPVTWSAKFSYIAITMPAARPEPGQNIDANFLKVVEGVNSAGLCFSVQSYPTAGGDDVAPDPNVGMLSATDLGAWALSQFTTVEEVKAALETQQVIVPRVPILGNQKMPFHYSVHDSHGKSVIIEFHYGERAIYDNPVGVMTNAPQFEWHLTNLSNYTFLTNVDYSTGKFGELEVTQPGAGIAKGGLPSSDTSVDRFVRAAFYAKFAEKQTDPDKAVQMVAHIMNNFDRPRGITIDPPGQGSSHLHLTGQAVDDIPTEFTSWTSLTDLNRRGLYIRDSAGMNFIAFHLDEIAKSQKNFKTIALHDAAQKPYDVSASFATPS